MFHGHAPHRSYRTDLPAVKPIFLLASPWIVIRFRTKMPSVLLSAVQRVQTPWNAVQESGDHEMGPNTFWGNARLPVCICYDQNYRRAKHIWELAHTVLTFNWLKYIIYDGSHFVVVVQTRRDLTNFKYIFPFTLLLLGTVFADNPCRDRISYPKKCLDGLRERA